MDYEKELTEKCDKAIQINTIPSEELDMFYPIMKKYENELGKEYKPFVYTDSTKGDNKILTIFAFGICRIFLTYDKIVVYFDEKYGKDNLHEFTDLQFALDFVKGVKFSINNFESSFKGKMNDFYCGLIKDIIALKNK